ncbi:MAG: PAS domain S-box protein, partial [Candidatus Thorarchaeota archaeon]
MSKRAQRKHSATGVREFRAFSEELPLAVLEAKMDFKLVYMNKYAMNLLAMEDKRKVGSTSVDALVVPEHRGQLEKAVAGLVKPGDSAVVSVELQSLAGNRIASELRIVLHGRTKKSQKLRVFATDTSIVGQIGPGFPFSDTILRTLLDNSHDALVVVDDDYKFEYVNDTAARLFGGVKEDLVGKDFRQFMEEDNAKAASERYELRRKGEPVPDAYPFEIITDSGKPMTVQVRASVATSDDGSRKTIVHILDVTDRRAEQQALEQTEERYRVLVETMNDGLAIDDEHGNLVYANDAFCEMLGRSQEEVVGRPWHEFTKDKDVEWVQAKISARKEGRAGRYELEWLNKNGEVVPTIISAAPLEDHDGTFLGTFGVITEISAQKEAEETIQFYLDLLTHDIANQLQVIITATGLLDHDIPPSYLQEAQGDILDAVERCNRLITKVKRAGEFRRLPTTHMELTNVLEEKVKVLVRVYGATVFVEDIEPPVHVRADALLGELLWNLLENAVRHNPREKPKVWVSGSREGQLYRLSVSDDGPGISSARKKSIFARRGHSGGVGLTLVSQMAKKYGG